MNQAPVAIVDPYSTGRDLAPAFAAHGVGAIAIRTAFPLPDGARDSWRPLDYQRVLDGTRPVAELAAELATLRPARILPGNESGVELADALTDRLLPEFGNVTARAAARRDKWQTALALLDAGLPALRQVCTDDPAVVTDWIAEHGIGELVLKPPNSAGTDSVHIARSDADWHGVFTTIRDSVNKLGLRNDRVLVQEFAPGTEYAVDTYSRDGTPALVSVCRYRKRTAGTRLGIYEAVDFLPADGPLVPALFDYVRDVLDAVGLRNGSAHVEVLDTPAGLRLVEVNARLAGGLQQALSRLATGDSQIDHTVRHTLRLPERGPAGYRLARRVTVAYLAAERAGVWQDAAEFAAAVRALPTFHDLRLPYLNGTHRPRVPRTEDVFTSLGQVVLAGADADAVAADHARVRALEHDLRITG